MWDYIGLLIIAIFCIVQIKKFLAEIKKGIYK